ncbi:hypothetical protein PVAP13_5KG187107 [Panicum virgatum]|uniref:Uncharacterized protein n=1 Tax=Panicum virgatum TaxID=38727 RepID=A0A8T0SJY9_PANVG|nr:hypothetical protein PVAP13_5KG187107 [Panicum virgatum]KAG2596847.1 hypothetical protein PVAP13_5KG187107 [Panicum virgatum]KAG2596848.1 hypothetical protein PVAP13_5KG187107 [Panicum virgatum]KAG2596849.1 hypothetical protein PVAP13_5KG187107 [Panicum virgatum]
MPSHRPGRPALSPSSRLLCRESQRRLPSPRRLDASRTRSAPPSSAVKHGRPPPPQPALHASQLAASSFPCSPFRLPRPAQLHQAWLQQDVLGGRAWPRPRLPSPVG